MLNVWLLNGSHQFYVLYANLFLTRMYVDTFICRFPAWVWVVLSTLGSAFWLFLVTTPALPSPLCPGPGVSVS